MTFTNKINYRHLEKGKWYKITLIKPEEEVRVFKMPTENGWQHYITYNAYFTELGPERKFTITLPFFRFRRVVDSLPSNLRKLEGKDLSFEIKKGKLGKMEIKDWRMV